MILRAVALLASLAVACLPALAADEAAVLQRLRHMAEDVQTIRSDFIQTKHLAVFRHEMISRGRFVYARPDRLRWEYVEPAASGFSLDGERGRRWDALSGTDRPFELGSAPDMAAVAGQLLAWAAFDLDALGREYQLGVLTEDPVRLRLVPKRARTREFLDHLDVEFAPGGKSVRVVELHEPDGDFTRIEFSHTVINGPLPEGLF